MNDRRKRGENKDGSIQTGSVRITRLYAVLVFSFQMDCSFFLMYMGQAANFTPSEKWKISRSPSSCPYLYTPASILAQFHFVCTAPCHRGCSKGVFRYPGIRSRSCGSLSAAGRRPCRTGIRLLAGSHRLRGWRQSGPTAGQYSRGRTASTHLLLFSVRCTYSYSDLVIQ